jgi:8-oxo-dGTP pyrophosphatase MutT (NUDIX family)
MKTVIDGVCIQERGILLVKKKDTWIIPGGKIEVDEEKEDCLRREFKEELPNIGILIKGFYKSFSGITPFTKKEVLVEIFFVEIIGNDISPSAEILDSKFFKKEELEPVKVSDITRDILNDLEKDGYL